MARNWNFRHLSFIYLLPVLLILSFEACTKPEIAFQNAYNGNNSTNVVTVDTFAVKVSTVFLDSFPTSGTATQLLGRYIDPFFGIITSQSYTDIGLPVSLPTITNLSVYDSIVLISRINRTFYGDTSKVQRFYVSQLTQLMNFPLYPVYQTSFFSNSSIPFNPSPLSSVAVQINPTAGLTSQRKGDSVIYSMPNSMGKDLFGLLYRQPDTIRDANTFRGYFKGLAIYPDTSLPGAVYGFNDTLTLRIYYHEPGVVTVNKTVDFRTVNQNTQFNQITANRAGTPTASLSASHLELPSTESGNQAYEQAITSLYIKLLFPTITNLLGYQDYLAVMKAELIIKPIQGTYSPAFGLPPAINLALTNDGNTIGSVLPSGSGSLNIDYLYGTNTSYSYDVTSYIQGALNQGAQNNAKNGLILIIPTAQFNTTFNRAVIGDAYNPQKSNQISLKISYASYY